MAIDPEPRESEIQGLGWAFLGRGRRSISVDIVRGMLSNPLCGIQYTDISKTGLLQVCYQICVQLSLLGSTQWYWSEGRYMGGGDKSIFLENKTDARMTLTLSLVLACAVDMVCNIPDSNFRQDCRVLKGENAGQRKHHLRREGGKKCYKHCFFKS